MGEPDRDSRLVAYILARLGCTHPFRVSRILLLADWRAEEVGLGRLTEGLSYVAEPYGFYVEGLQGVLERLERSGCLRRREEERCLEYTCAEPGLMPQEREVLDEVIREVYDLSDRELNRLVTRDERYVELTGRGR